MHCASLPQPLKTTWPQLLKAYWVVSPVKTFSHQEPHCTYLLRTSRENSILEILDSWALDVANIGIEPQLAVEAAEEVRIDRVHRSEQRRAGAQVSGRGVRPTRLITVMVRVSGRLS